VVIAERRPGSLGAAWKKHFNSSGCTRRTSPRSSNALPGQGPGVTLLKAQVALAALGQLRGDGHDAAAKLLMELVRR